MGALEDEFEFVAGSAHRAAALQRAVCTPVASDPEAGGRALARHLDLLYQAIEAHIARRRAEFSSAPDDTVREDAIVEMRRLVWEVRNLQSNMSWLQAAQRPPLDLGTTYFVENVARALVAPNVEVTVVAADRPSYATSSDPWEPWITAWGTGVPGSEPTVVVVFVPQRERLSGLLHPLIVHELGHATDSEHGIIDEIWQDARGRSRLSARFSAAVSAFARSRRLDVAQARDHVAERLRYWLAEVFCDSVAVHHLGPTYLYSFLAEVVAASIDETGPKHPPPRQRTRLLLEQLDKLGWKDAMERGDPELNAWVRDLASVTPTYSDVEGFLTWAVDDLRALVRRKVDRLLKNRTFAPNPEELAEVATLLEVGIPPAQLSSGAAVARESIILACWHAALAGAGYGPKALADAPDAPELADLLPAALELSALTASWETR